MTSIKSVKSHGRFTTLLVSMLAMFVVTPWVGTNNLVDTVVVRLVMALLLCAALYTVGDSKKSLIIASVLAVSTVLLEIFHFLPFLHFFHFPSSANLPQVFSLVVFILFAFYIAWVMVLRILEHGTVSTDTLAGAICVYLMIGIGFGSIYTLIETILPGSFRFTFPGCVNQSIRWTDLGYFSFVTLTTSGYGDIAPIYGEARVLSVLEMLIGVFYPAIMVARLVSQYAGRHAKHID